MTSTTVVKSPTSRVRFGHARVDITPPVGIYHRMWGAARHERASGVHRPLVGDVMFVGPIGGDGTAFVRANLDFCALAQSQEKDLKHALADGAGISPDEVIISHSHTHSGGWFVPDRIALPGGELIEPFLRQVGSVLRDAAIRAAASTKDVTITYGRGRCDLAGNRDYWDDLRAAYSCGFNPDVVADDTVIVGRVTGADNRFVASLVNYACHPTTLAWENSLISPDFAGSLRETVEAATGAPCIFVQGACGDLGPRHGFVGDVDVADRNGRQLGYAALSALSALGPPMMDFAYAGPIESGATLGRWNFQQFSEDRRRDSSRFAGGAFVASLAMKDRPDADSLTRRKTDWEEAQRAADARGDAMAARDAGAHAERARRWLGRLSELPTGSSYPVGFTVYRLGDAVWVTTGGEPYNQIQQELRRRFPDDVILVSPVSGDLQIAYLLPTDRYGKGLYQEEPSILAPGCLERLTEAIAQRIVAVP